MEHLRYSCEDLLSSLRHVSCGKSAEALFRPKRFLDFCTSTLACHKSSTAKTSHTYSNMIKHKTHTKIKNCGIAVSWRNLKNTHGVGSQALLSCFEKHTLNNSHGCHGYRRKQLLMCILEHMVLQPSWVKTSKTIQFRPKCWGKSKASSWFSFSTNIDPLLWNSVKLGVSENGAYPQNAHCSCNVTIKYWGSIFSDKPI